MIINEDEVFVKSKPSNPWARISEVAAKVGVKPCGDPPPPPQWCNVRVGSAEPTLKATGADGQQYDVWEVIIAALDKMERGLTMGLPPQFVYDENVKLRAEIKQMQLQIAALKEELRGRADTEDRLRTALTAITQGAPFGYSAHAYEDIARNALNKK